MRLPELCCILILKHSEERRHCLFLQFPLENLYTTLQMTWLLSTSVDHEGIKFPLNYQSCWQWLCLCARACRTLTSMWCSLLLGKGHSADAMSFGLWVSAIGEGCWDEGTRSWPTQLIKSSEVAPWVLWPPIGSHSTSGIRRSRPAASQDVGLVHVDAART